VPQTRTTLTLIPGRDNAAKTAAIDSFLHPLFGNYLSYTSSLRKLVSKADTMFNGEQALVSAFDLQLAVELMHTC
jgi:hypothetical protein